MSGNNGFHAPLLDSEVLERLRHEVDDDEGVWKVFVRSFMAELPRRTERLRRTLTTGDCKGAMDAVLSLRTSSQMIGAERLAQLADHLEQSLRQEETTGNPAVALPRLAAAHLRGLNICAQQTIQVLQEQL